MWQMQIVEEDKEEPGGERRIRVQECWKEML